MDSFLNDPFTLVEIAFALNKINTHSAPGPGNIKVAHISNSLCCEFLCDLFNKCLTLGSTPDAWLQSIIKPIPKPGGNPLDPSDYRDISLQSIAVKTLCSVMNTRLCEYLELNNLLAEEQNGFRAGRSCQDHIFSLHTIVQNRKLQKKDTFAVFILILRKLLIQSIEISSGPSLNIHSKSMAPFLICKGYVL